MEEASIRFEVVEDVIEHRLQALGLRPKRDEGCIDTGYDYFHLHRSETQVLSVEEEPVFFASLEMNAVLKSPFFGEVVIPELVTMTGDSPETALERCAQTYMDVSFPAMQALFDSTVPSAQTPIKLVSYTDGQELNWQVFTGQLQVLNEAHQLLEPFPGTVPPIALVLDTVSGFLAEPRLHWCKLYGAQNEQRELQFGCAIDGRKAPQAEAEMAEKFQLKAPVAGSWEFRQFLVMLPGGEPDAELAATARRAAAQHIPEVQPDRKKWWPFGRKH
jgi:hypothetical protein